MSGSRAEEGQPFPFGATPTGDGVNFALFSAHATGVELCLFDPEGARETDRIALPGRTDDVWHGFVGGLAPGQLYGYRVHGPYRPEAGHRFDPSKLLVDPYARLLHGSVRQDPALFQDPAVFQDAAPSADGHPGERPDSAAFVPKAVVVGSTGPALEPEPPFPRRPWSETVIYEAHIRGLTQLHPEIPEAIRGTCEALGHPAIVAHLLRLGVTALELLPIHAIADEPALVARGLSNYWGYSTLAYLAPEPRYLGPSGPAGLRGAIRTLHEAGIEVILDVVYNHTAEGEEDGPTLSFRGIDNVSYYKPEPGHPGRPWNATGCGNTLDVSHPRVLQLVLDSMRHWVVEYGVDGFRFDLAPVLARDPYAFNPRAAFFAAVAQDPVLGRVKLIAEPWDVGPDGYRLGAFPRGWAEWNDRFRDSVRAFWRGDPGSLPRLTQGLTGSKEIFQAGGRGPFASVNYVASHDGFTLRDLVSYERKHNARNGEQNRDGHADNLSANHGVEGESRDPAVTSARARSVRNMLATVFLAQGVPMLLAGDELSRTQAGNNNAYCQDNPTSWVDWSTEGHDPDLPDFVAELVALRQRCPALRRGTFLTGEASPASGLRDVYWLDPSGRPMTGDDWADPGRRVIGMQVGNDIPDGRLLLLLNGSADPVAFRLDPELPGAAWRPVFDTARPSGRVGAETVPLARAGTFDLPPRSMVLFQHQN